jgi:3-methylfumaryl-CoA hydratase
MLSDLTRWIGGESVAQDLVSVNAVLGLRCTISDGDSTVVDGEAAPHLIHWLLFPSYHPMADVGPDGHPKRGGFLPPVELPRRMWAGSDLEFLRPLQVGRQVIRRSTIADVSEKHGRTGRLVFVAVDHEICDGAHVCVRERHHIVYRDLPGPGSQPAAARPAPASPQWMRQVVPDPVLLFRYSALTFNGHRIHYDRGYAMEAEGYPGLVVHGPLIATLLLDEFVSRHPALAIGKFSFRAVKPIFDIAPFYICGSVDGDGHSATLFASDEDGSLCMEATVTLL